MSETPLVSVRIPSYNHEKYIYDCISSILNQTYQNFEIVIVDDCSTDGTVEVIRGFNDQRIKLETLHRNSGMNVAVERCMLQSTGKYVANISSDDMWEHTKLEKQVNFLEDNYDFDAVFTQVEFIGEDGNILDDSINKFANIFDYENRDPSQWLRRFFYLGNCLCNPSVMIKREVYKSLNYQDKRFVSLSDFDLWVRFSMNHKLWILDEKLTKFRVRDNEMNISANTPGNRNRAAFEYKQILDNFLTIKDLQLLTSTFPESTRFGDPKDIIIPYFLGRLAIETNSMFHRLWGCEKIFQLMSDGKAVACLEENCDFRYNDFLNLTKTTDFFNILNSVPEIQAIEELVDECKTDPGKDSNVEENHLINSVPVLQASDEAEFRQAEVLNEELNKNLNHYFFERIGQSIYETCKLVLKRISPRLFNIIKGIYLSFKK